MKFYVRIKANLFFAVLIAFFTLPVLVQAKTYKLGDIEDTSPITISAPKYVKPPRNDVDVIVGVRDVLNAGVRYSSSSKLLATNAVESDSVITLPTEKDWSDIVTPVKDQGGCGSCVIFSTTAALESFLLKKNKKTFDISEQYGLSCHMPANLCNTGTMLSSYLSPLQTLGTSEELSQFPYTASFGSCSSAGEFLTAYNFAFKVNSFEKVGIKSADDLKATLVKYGPVIGAMQVYQSFYDYTSGLYKPSQVEKKLGGHAILIVGYSDNIGGFKVKNSWGTSWGDKGFFWIAYDQVGGQSDLGTRGDGVFAITDASSPAVAPTYLISSHGVTPSSATAGTSFTFTANLNSALPSSWKVKIDLGSGVLSQMTNFAGGGVTNYILARNLSNVGTYTYKIGIYDSRDILQGTVSSGSYKVGSALPVTTGYTKIANNGSSLPDSAKLGSAPTDWACTKDNKTGLIWEIKTDDGGLRDKDWTYNRYDKFSGLAKCFDSECNAFSYVKSVNQKELCGLVNWRIPNKGELGGLANCFDGKYQAFLEKNFISQTFFSICANNVNQQSPNRFDIAAVNTTYFPDIGAVNWFWSSSIIENTNGNVVNVIFVKNNGSWYGNGGDYSAIRLVHDSKTIPITPVTPTTNVAPTLKLISNSPDVVSSPVANYTVGVSYNVTVQADDTDGNLKSVDIDWGDGAKESKASSNGSQTSFTHTYNFVGNYTWKVIAYDTNGSSSSSISKTLKVENKSVPVVTGFAAPKLLTPENNAYLPLKKSMKFTWEKVNQATKYQIIFSTDSNFSSYDKTKNKCLNIKTCFTYTVASTSYALNAKHAMLGTEGSTYFWQVQSLNKTERSSSSEIRIFTTGTPKPAIPPEIVKISAPAENTLGKKMTFTSTLDSAPSQNAYIVKISINDENFQTMSAGTIPIQFFYEFTPNELGDHHFTVAIFDKNNVVIDTLGDDFSVSVSADSIKLFSAMPVVYSGEEVTQDQAISIGEKTVYLDCNFFPVKAVISSNEKGNGNLVVDNFITLNKKNVCPANGGCFTGITNGDVWADIYYNMKQDSTAKALDVYGAISPIDVSSELIEGKQFVKFNIMEMGITSANSDVWLTTNCVSLPRATSSKKPAPKSRLILHLSSQRIYA